jgi:hypothetical protein
VEHRRTGPQENASGANLLTQVKLAERRVLEGVVCEYHPPFTVERRTSTRSPFNQGAGVDRKAMSKLD